jgi:putative FmdB family regulatory protein
MPIFEYQCGSCGKEFETLVRGSSPAPACPACHGTDLHKKLSTFSAVSKSAFGAVSSSATLDTLPADCPNCGDPGGPGSCQF